MHGMGVGVCMGMGVCRERSGDGSVRGDRSVLLIPFKSV